MMRRAPAGLRRAARRVVATAIDRGVALRARLGIARDVPKVCYGAMRIPGLGARTHGGLVKVQYLHQVFPNAPWHFNVLYLVSSRLSPGALALGRAARARGIPLVWNQNGVAYPGWYGPGSEQVNAPMAELLAGAAHVFYQSAFCKLSADRFLGVPPPSWEILHNPVDIDAFSPGVRDDRPLTILVGGTQDARYRVSIALDVLARVAARRPDVRMLVTGRLRWAPDVRACGDEARRLAGRAGVADRVTFTGPYTQRDAPALYRRADVLLHCKYNDPSPGLVGEALACGLPVVYSASGGMPELVGPDAGIGLPVDLNWDQDLLPDPGLLASAVLAVADRLPALATAARRRAVEHFALDRWLARHRAAFLEILR